MKRVACLLCLCLATQGCATWWDAFKKDPVTQTERAISGVSAVLSLAQILFGQIKMNLPPESQEPAQAEFDKAYVACIRGQLALKKAVDAAREAQQENPDFVKVKEDLEASVKKLHELVDGLKGKQSSKKLADGKFGVAPLSGEQEFEDAVKVSLR